jgi:predicted Zn-dependent protease
MRKGRLDEAQKLIDERLRKNPPSPEYLLVLQAQLRALKGDFGTAEASIVSLMQKIPISEDRHHYTYDAACIYALAGNSSEAVKWLKETAATGFPNYPLFARDHYLDRIRNTPEFVRFIAEQKEQWERYRQEFDN